MEIYLVGGAVRDQLLGITAKDRDWVVVGATPAEMLQQGYKPVGSDFPVFIDPKSGEEYALARTERKSGHGYHGFELCSSPEVTLEEDLMRRDLTINAIAMDSNGTLIDPYHGQQDLKSRTLRHVSEAFSEDPLRVLRVARFASRFAPLGFSIAHETLTLMQQLSEQGELSYLTAERVWQETERALAQADASAYWQALEQCGALILLFPLLQPIFHSDSADYADALEVCRNRASSEERFSALVSLATKKLPDTEALERIDQLCEQLRTPKRVRTTSTLLRQLHPTLADFAQRSAEERLRLIEQADLIRQPDRLPPLWKAATLLHKGMSPSDEEISQLLKRLKQIDSKPFIEQGVRGPALGEAIRQARLRECHSKETGDIF